MYTLQPNRSLQLRKGSAPPALPPKSPLIDKYQNLSRNSLTSEFFSNKILPPVAPKRKASARLSIRAESHEDIESRFSNGSVDETPTLVSIQKALNALVEKVDKLQQNHFLLEQRLQKLETSKGNFDKPRKAKKNISSMNQVDVSN